MRAIKYYFEKYFTEIGLTFLLLGHLLILLNIKFTAWPEMINWPYLMLNNFLPYRDIAIAHNPFLPFVLTGFYKLAGVGIWELEVFTWMVILISDILLFYIIEKIVNPKTAVFALAFFIPLQIFYDGNGMWFDLFMTPLVLTSFFFTYSKKYFLAGIFWALAFLTKQTAVWFLVPILFTMYSLQGQSFKGRIKGFLLGTAIVFIPFYLLLTTYHLLTDYLFWAVKFGIFILPGSVGQISLPSFKQAVVYFFPFLPFLYLLLKQRPNYTLLAIWTLAGILSVYPRFETFHFQPALPFLAIAFAIFIKRYFDSKNKVMNSVFAFYFIVLSLFVGRFLINNYHRDIRFFDRHTVESTDYIKKLMENRENTYFLNVWENMYFMTSTLPATKPLVPHLAWYMELPGVQEEIVEDLKKDVPKHIFVGEFKGGELSTYVPKLVQTYITSEYQIVNVVNDITVYEK